MESLYKNFRAGIKRGHFLEEGDPVLVGVSGGVDSMVLLSLLLRLQRDMSFRFSVAHVNYGLRGEESETGEKTVRDFSKRYGISCYVTRAALDLDGEDNFQKMARDFRYHFFEEVALQIKASKVMMAHHLEDQVETIMAGLLRGVSLHGLKGMQMVRPLRANPQGQHLLLVRPMLFISKKDLVHYAATHAVPFVEDSSNQSGKYWRNQLRHRLLPVIEELRPKSFGKILRFGEEMGELARYISEEAKKWLGTYAKKDEKVFWLPRPRLIRLPKSLRLEILRQAALLFKGGCQNLKRDHLTRCERILLGGKPEGTYSLPEAIKFVRKGEDLLFEDAKSS